MTRVTDTYQIYMTDFHTYHGQSSAASHDISVDTSERVIDNSS